MRLLEVDQLSKSFGGVQAVDNCTFELEQGSLVGLIGPNGAGKTTTFNLISGILEPDSGEIRLNGENIDGLPPYKVCRKGVSRSFQTVRDWSQMSVIENVLVAAQHQPGESPYHGVFKTAKAQQAEEDNIERAEEMLDLVGLYDLRNNLASELSVGQQKLLEIGRALMIDPDLMLLDEPIAGVNPALVEDIIDYLKTIRDEQNVTILTVEHDFENLSDLVDEMIVMSNGQVLERGTPEAIKSDEQVREAYLGGAA